MDVEESNRENQFCRARYVQSTNEALRSPLSFSFWVTQWRANVCFCAAQIEHLGDTVFANGLSTKRFNWRCCEGFPGIRLVANKPLRMVVVDQLTEYMPPIRSISHLDMTMNVAFAFTDHIYEPHGLPKVDSLWSRHNFHLQISGRVLSGVQGVSLHLLPLIPPSSW